MHPKAVNNGAGSLIHATDFYIVPSRRNLMTTLSSALTDVISQKWACETSMIMLHRFTEIEVAHKPIGRGEKHLAGYGVCPR
jgi:hypothetical protein